jgi:hypothetical protein
LKATPQCDEKASIKSSLSQFYEADDVFFAMLDGLCGKALQFGDVEGPLPLCVT